MKIIKDLVLSVLDDNSKTASEIRKKINFMLIKDNEAGIKEISFNEVFKTLRILTIIEEKAQIVADVEEKVPVRYKKL